MRSAALVAALSTCCLCSGHSVHASTVAMWCFDDGAPGTVSAGAGSILDCSGSGHDGTPIGLPLYCAATTASEDVWLRLGGQGDRVFVPDSSAFELIASLSLEAWIRIDAIPPGNVGWGGQILFRGDDLGAQDPYFLAVTLDGRLAFHVESLSGSSHVFSPSAVPFGVIMHVAGTLDDETGEQHLYIDGALVATATTSIRPFGPLSGPQPGLGIGSLQSSVENQYFDGAIAAIRVSDVALTPDQFLQIPSFEARREDLNRDCLVDGADLGILLAQWGRAIRGTAADFDASGAVDGADLGVLLAAWN